MPFFAEGIGNVSGESARLTGQRGTFLRVARKRCFFWVMPANPLDDLSARCIATPTPSRQEAITRFEHLNHSDPDELLENTHYLPSDCRRHLSAGLNKIEAYQKLFARPADHYLSNMAMIATSSWHSARRYCLWGVTNGAGRSQPCHQWTLCPPCSYRQRKRETLAAYLTRFHRTSWFQVTISYVTAFGDPAFDEDRVRLCWQAAYQGVRDLRQAGYIRGATTRSELHLERFLPLTYHPHIHAVVDADQVDRAFLAERVFAYRTPATGARITFPVSIHHWPLGTEKAFANALSYQGKALDIATPYEAAWPRGGRDHRRLAPALNHEVDEFLDAFDGFTADAHQVRYLGTCHHASRQTLRIPRAQRRAQRDVVAAILVESNLDAWDEDVAEPATVFHPPTS